MDESKIPIDINIGKLQDWLVSRRHVSKEWQKSVIPVRTKINLAIQDIPAHNDIAALLSGSYINYFHCQPIIDILKETEADTKNLFGRYTSQRMIAWQDIVRSYEKENLYLAEAAQMLVRNISYEIPGLKKQIAKEEQIQSECEKKHADLLKNEASIKSDFLSSCRQLGIKGEKIKRELLERLQELPEIYNKIGKALSPLRPGIDLYIAFTKYILGDKAPKALPLLSYVVEHGNTTVYEWAYGEPPLSVEPDPILIESDDEDGHGDQMDGCEDENDVITIKLMGGDLGIGDAYAAIDWGSYNRSPEDDEETASVADISLEESGIVIEDQGMGGGVAQGRDALSLLDNPSTRNQIMDQLSELECFLRMRIHETQAAADSTCFSLAPQLPAESGASLDTMLAAVRAAAAEFEVSHIKHLHNVKHSPRYLDVLTAQMKQKLSLAEKLSAKAARENEKRSAAEARAAALRPVLTKIIERTKELQAHIEDDISKKYKGRPVKIIGGVQFL